MKVRYTKTLKDGRRHVLVELAIGEPVPRAHINEDAFYRLNYPHDEIVQGHYINDPQRVYWDSLSQKWEEA